MSSIIVPSSQSKPRGLIPLWLKGKWGFLGIVFIVYILFNLAWTYFHWGGPERVSLIANLFSFTPSLLSTILAWRLAAQKSLSMPLRRAWFILGLCFFMFLMGNLVWAYLEVVLQVEPFPSIADVFYLAFYPLGLLGLISLSSARHNPREQLTLSLDLLSVLTVASMFVGYFIIVPTAATSSDLLTQLIAPAYPVGSLMMIGGILAVLYRRPSPNTQSALAYLLIGMLFFVGADFAFSYTSLTGTYTIGGWTDASWNVAQLFFGLAALRKVYRGPASEGTPGSDHPSGQTYRLASSDCSRSGLCIGILCGDHPAWVDSRMANLCLAVTHPAGYRSTDCLSRFCGSADSGQSHPYLYYSKRALGESGVCNRVSHITLQPRVCCR